MSEGVPGSDWALNRVLRRVFILGTGLLGTSIGLALRAGGFTGSIVGWDKDSSQSETAFRLGAIEAVAADPLEAAEESQLIVLATPVYSILDWMERLAPVLSHDQVLTDVGSTKAAIYEAGERLYNTRGKARFVAGHPMAGKEVGGAAHAEAELFRGAAWIFAQEKLKGTPLEDRTSPQADGIANDWTLWIREFGCRLIFMEPTRHDELLAWVSHLPQFLSTALTALIEHEVGAAPELNSIGGRALREMTRLGSSPYSMWRDVALTNTDAVAKAIYALEQRLAHLRENLRTPELRDEFERANRFRKS
jgi:prephenate dehydrogenase